MIRFFTLLVLLVYGSAFAIAATNLTEGEWEVEAVQAGDYNARLKASLVFTSQIAVVNGYRLEGYIDWPLAGRYSRRPYRSWYGACSHG